MATLNITRLDEDILSRLRIQAEAHNIPIEEEARQVLKSSLFPKKKIGDLALSLFGQEGIELELPKYGEHKPIDFSE